MGLSKPNLYFYHWLFFKMAAIKVNTYSIYLKLLKQDCHDYTFISSEVAQNGSKETSRA